MIRKITFAIVVLCVSACGAVAPTELVRPEISPQEFVLIPCGPARADRPCALVIAGGKRVLFGAPSGVAATLSVEDLRGLDAVMLPSLKAGDIEGLDEVRNESWRAGRSVPLRVVGPEGTVGIVEALNKVFEQADALRIVEEGIPKGGYDAAVLEGFELPPRTADATVFDTGDVNIRLFDATFVVEYNYEMGKPTYALLTGCVNTKPFEIRFNENFKILNVNCREDADMVWPLSEIVYIKP